MNNNPINLATYIQNPSKLQMKLAALKNQKSLIILGPLLKKTPTFDSRQTVIQVDTSVLEDLDLTLVLGDGDSVKEQQQQNFDYLFPKNKNFTDFEALLHLLKEFPLLEELHFYGFWGARFDHHILIPCQITDLLLQCKNIKQASMYGENNYSLLQILSAGVHTFDEQISFSVIALQQQSIELKGNISYPGKFSLAAWSGHGISNAALGNWTLQCQLPIWKYILSNESKN